MVHNNIYLRFQRYDLPFTETSHLRNPMNDDKPVKISKDGTELTNKIGMALCSMIDEGALKAQRKR